MLKKKIFLSITTLAVITVVFIFSVQQQTIDFNTQVKPILNKNCITCHGGVKQKGGFSLLFRSQALANTASGKPAIIPGDPDNSDFIRRLTLNDPEERMPYKHEALTKVEINILRNWIKQGAKWGNHWAYVPVQPTKVPTAKVFYGTFNANNSWVNNNIDYFILQKLNEKKLTTCAQADKQTLLRRVSLDIIGMPAPKKIVDQYYSDNSNKAYENLVDSLLASKHFGERWAAMWLDLARYADTKGYERDNSRYIWRYRDWVINAFNDDKPYNDFLTEQLAGDLLPNATDAQLIATAFHRNTMTNDEGGTDNEEFRTAAVLDRVNTTWEALMGTTFACVQCHSHPYDPFKHEEYYKFMAFFNNTRDEDTYDDYPVLKNFSDSAQIEKGKLIAWLQQNTSLQETTVVKHFLQTGQPAFNSITCDQFFNSELSDTKWLALRNNATCRLKKVNLTNKNELTYRYKTSPLYGGIWQIHLDSAKGKIIATIPMAIAEKKWKIDTADILITTGVHDLFFTYTNTKLKKIEDTGVLFDWFYFGNSFPGADKTGYAENKKRYWDLLNLQPAGTPIVVENGADMQRSSHVFERGNWLVKGNIVTPGVPGSLNPMPANAPSNRLGMAMWLTSKQNPLTARTMVNRIWEQVLGVGLVETLEDIGTQGATPTHKELLDYLSYKFMYDYNWSIKKLLKEIVLSATYRQESKSTKQQLAVDPANKYYARGPRVRLSAEQIRDQALTVTGLISDKMYGPSVMPFQPEGIWLSPWNGQYWATSKAEDKYRRAIYTYWKRTAPYPSMVTFDGVAREVCTARRIRTNTPLQALVTLNDEAYLDMARKMTYQLEKNYASNSQQQITVAYENITGHAIKKTILEKLIKLYDLSVLKFTNNENNACEMAGGVNSKYNTASTAALVVVTNAILNLDEVVMKN